ncbi:unnamed protein product [Porites evermanni]|uniref:Soluble interferon alpha/beta receptor OPG204 n=1 Tax=Porites evermanni TaxID=104178 RepID=A0ABN8LK22_9CNID|nr:unnamed protein product [Porites evermanni]
MYSLKSTVIAVRGSDVTLVCKGSNVQPLDTDFMWKFNTETVENKENRNIKLIWHPKQKQAFYSLHILNVSEKDVGDYRCIAKGGVGGQFLRDLNSFYFLTVLNLTASPPNVTIEEGRTAPLQCKVMYSNAMDVWTFWLFNGKMIEPRPFHTGNEQDLSNTVTNISTLVLKNAMLSQTGVYTCGANSTGVIKTQNITVTVKDLEGPTLVQTKSNIDAVDGENTTLSCNAVYPEAFFVDTFWIFNGSRINSNDKYKEKNTSPWLEQSERSVKRMKIGLTIYNIGLNDSGEYICALNTSLGLHLKNVSVKVTRKPGSQPVKSPPDLDAGDFEYDVFLTYCRKDFSWVDKELLPLFNHNQVKYCVDFIHFELGKAFLQSMVEGIYKSRKVLAVWSANYASSKYCKQELDYALQRSFEKSDTAVIIIRIDWTDPTRLPKTLRTKTFLDYHDSAERKGWEKRLIQHLKPPKQPKKMIVSIV